MTTQNLLEVLGANTIVKLNVFTFEGETHIRISSTSKKVKKLFNRTFGTGKPICKALIKHSQIHEGLNELSLGDFVEILESDKIQKKSRMSRALKFADKANYESLEDINWEELPCHDRKTKSAVRRMLMKKNHEFMKKEGYSSVEDLDMDSLPVQGFKEKEVIKFFDQ